MFYVIKNKNVKEVMRQLSNFDNRYQHYIDRFNETTWRLEKIKESDEDISLVLVDNNFEIPRGVHSDCPILYIHLEQNDTDVILMYSYKWRKWKKILTWILGVFTVTNWLLCCLWSLMIGKRIWLIFGFITFFLLVEVIWLIKNIKHDQLTCCVFNKILNKTFKGKTG